MTRSAVIEGGEQEENRVLRRYATERMANPHEIPFRKVDWRAMRGAAEQKLHRALGKHFRPGCKKNTVIRNGAKNATVVREDSGSSYLCSRPINRH